MRVTPAYSSGIRVHPTSMCWTAVVEETASSREQHRDGVDLERVEVAGSERQRAVPAPCTSTFFSPAERLAASSQS